MALTVTLVRLLNPEGKSDSGAVYLATSFYAEEVGRKAWLCCKTSEIAKGRCRGQAGAATAGLLVLATLAGVGKLLLGGVSLATPTGGWQSPAVSASAMILFWV
jgi:hypothetical protein